jgi:hypothetical protein
MEHLKFPIGKFVKPNNITREQIDAAIWTIKTFAQEIALQHANMSAAELNTPYRPQGWTAAQVIIHLADSHLNACTRFKLTLTEDAPTIKPYMEQLWAQGPDYDIDMVENALNLIKAIHVKWVRILDTMSNDDFERTYVHPQYNEVFTLAHAVLLYDWHCRHHLAHITLCKV